MITMDIRKRHIVRTLRAAVLLLFVSAFLSRCASMMTPTGGPRDSLPPVIVNMTPDNFSTNRPLVNHEKIYIEFDEFVQLKDQQKEFFTSPQMKKKPLVSLRGRGVVIQLRDTLEANTTYALNFGSAIRDNNEGNPHEFTILELAEKVIRLTGSRSKIAFRELPHDDPRQRQPDITLAREKLDYDPSTQLEEGLKHTIEYFRSLN